MPLTLPEWNYTLDLRSVDTNAKFPQWRDDTVRRIQAAKFYDEFWTCELETIVEALADAGDPATFEMIWSRGYGGDRSFVDWANSYRVWIKRPGSR